MAELAWGGTGKRAVASAARTRPLREASTGADSAGGVEASASTASRCAEMLRGVDIRLRLAADGGHRTVRLEKALVINAMTGLFGPHFPGPSLHDVLIARAGAQQVSQWGFGIAKEAIADGAIGSKAGAVAIAAEGVGDRGNDAQRAARAIRSADLP